MMRFHRTLTTVLAALMLVSVSPWALAQASEDAWLGGGSDISASVTVALPQGASIPAIHHIFVDNPSDEPIEVQFRADAPDGISIQPEWQEHTVPARSKITNHFGVEVSATTAAGKYPVVVQLVRSDIPAVSGQITNIPAIQTAFTVEVTGESSTVVVRGLSSLTGQPVSGTLVLAARADDGRGFEIDRLEGTVIESTVAPGDYRASFLLGHRVVATEDFLLQDGQILEVHLEVETVAFVVAALRATEEGGRLVVVDLVASINNETPTIPGPASIQTRVTHDGTEVDLVVLRDMSELGAGLTEATTQYRPDGGWLPGTYRFSFELMTPDFMLTAPDHSTLEVPARSGWDLGGIIAALTTREIIALAAAAVLAVVLVERLIRFLLRRRRRSEARAARQGRRTARAAIRQPRKSRRGKDPSQAQPKPTWVNERIASTTGGRSQWENTNPAENDPDDGSPLSSPPPPDRSSEGPVTPASPAIPVAVAAPTPPRGSHIAHSERALAEPRSTQPISTSVPAGAASGDTRDTVQMVEALRVVQRISDDGNLAPGWSITDATLVYWAMISPGVHDSLSAVGMTEDEYGTAMRRLFTRGLLDRARLPREASRASPARG